MSEPTAARALLLSTYDLGRQPQGLATAAAWLRELGVQVSIIDLAIDQLDEAEVEAADLLGVHLPMHTATRLAMPLLPRLRDLNPTSTIICFGLYAELNAGTLEGLGADATISGEFESTLADMAADLMAGRSRPSGRVRFTGRQPHLVPDRLDLAPLDRYVKLRLDHDTERLVGYTETTRGCKHLCRHCPIVPIYQGKFRAIGRDVVLADVDQLVAAGAEHITFGDPDFFNGPTHGLRVAAELHRRYPAVTWDCTIKVEHLARFEHLLPEMAETGCILVTTAVESFDDDVLTALDKNHTEQDFERALAALRQSEIGFNPTFVAFTPLTTIESYRRFLDKIRSHGLIDAVSPIQYAIRLLVTRESSLVEIADIADVLQPFDADQLVFPWRHADPRVDRLQADISAVVAAGADDGADRHEIFHRIWREVAFAADPAYLDLTSTDDRIDDRKPIPYLTEPWYC